MSPVPPSDIPHPYGFLYGKSKGRGIDRASFDKGSHLTAVMLEGGQVPDLGGLRSSLKIFTSCSR